MAALFPPWTNTFARVVLLSIVCGVSGLFLFLLMYVRSPFFTYQSEPIAQPVEFDHRHHVDDDGIDCRYCHTSVETSSSAGIPPLTLCLNCHSQVWNKSPLLDPIRADYFEDRPFRWRRVNYIPDFVYFNHSIHVNKGVGCVTCHGRVDEMPAVMQATPMTMGFCLGCHRAPDRHLRPRDEVTSMTWQPAGDPLALGRKLAVEYGVHTRTSCTTCHR